MFAVKDTIYFTFPAERFIVRNGCEKIDRPHFRNTCRGLGQLIRRHELQASLQKNRVKKLKQQGQKASAGFRPLLCCGCLSSQLPSRRLSDARINHDCLMLSDWGQRSKLRFCPFKTSVCKEKEQPWATRLPPIKMHHPRNSSATQ